MAVLAVTEVRLLAALPTPAVLLAETVQRAAVVAIRAVRVVPLAARLMVIALMVMAVMVIPLPALAPQLAAALLSLLGHNINIKNRALQWQYHHQEQILRSIA
jgi:hypothetical protein